MTHIREIYLPNYPLENKNGQFLSDSIPLRKFKFKIVSR